MSDARWVAIAFDKQTELMVKEVELIGVSTAQIVDLYKLTDDDEAESGRFDVGPEHAKALWPYSHGQLDLSIGDWQIEARDPR